MRKRERVVLMRGDRRARLVFLLCGVICLLLILPHALAQQQQDGNFGLPPPPPLKPKPTPTPRIEDMELGEGDTLSVSTTEVLLPVTVRDQTGRLVTGLRREDFRIFEDGREQPLTDLDLRQVPVDVVLMIDASSSVAGNLEDFRRAVEEFADRLAPEDRISLVKFDDRVELLQDWTQSRVQLRRSLRRISPGVFTRFYDALLLAAREQFQSAQRRHAVVVLTDGIDSRRGYASLETALAALLQSGAGVYAISNTEIERAKKRRELDTLLSSGDSAVQFNQLRIGDLREGLRVLDASEQNLERLAELTGGRIFKPASFANLDSVYREVAEDLRSQYSIYYSPQNKARDGRFRRVRVEIRNPQLRAKTRIGYFAPRG
ncbi:MAG TPA: VWA domain-containing protein [Pyrinomonadaceae bacterium]|nr:VWA domain-containing protein [Pyrinomonadaceae bacterium]